MTEQIVVENKTIQRMTVRVPVVGQDERLEVEVRYDDECCNGHADFSITGYRTLDARTVSGFFYASECASYPGIALLIRLHLCDQNGAHMHAAANGAYALRSGAGFNKQHALSTLRMTEEEYEPLRQAAEVCDETYFKYVLEDMGIVARWAVEAEEGRECLRQLTGREVNKGQWRRSNYTPLTEEERKAVAARLAEGQYTPEAVEARREAAARALLKKSLSACRMCADKKAHTARFAEYAVRFVATRLTSINRKYAQYHHADFTDNDSAIQLSVYRFQDDIDLDDFRELCRSIKSSDFVDEADVGSFEKVERPFLPCSVQRLEYRGLVYDIAKKKTTGAYRKPA